MRDTEFRAWNKKRKKYYYSDKFDYLSVFFANYEQVCTFEQYTGLKDKNGKEIYEGDIVRSAVLLSGEIINVSVQWIDCGFIANGLIGTREAENCEVIGNIHENKDLLK